ncbi:MAG TPA: outer membrane beta-barrel protein [Vicinamibacterales bacterium]|jgi:hypothetical protein|nr:outer membrane beta-barrel protein [Vicinamibacterales bacterium]
MKRFARVVSCVAVCLLFVSARGQAQTQDPSDTSRFYVEFTGGATLGHKSSGSVGGEIGYQVTGPYFVFFEGGHMANVGTTDLDARAKTIGDAVGATASASLKINYFDAGIRYNPKVMLSVLHPYLALGFGAAAVKVQTSLAVNGTVVPPESLGVQFGSDLNGTTTKGFMMIGGGVNYPFAKRYFVDGSIRYGRVFARTSAIENDTGINTLRVQFGLGVRLWDRP